MPPVVAIVSIGTLFSFQVQKWGKLVPFFYVKSCPSISDKEMYGNSTCTSAACLLQRKRGAFAGQQSPYRHGYVYAGPVGRSGWSSGSSGTRLQESTWSLRVALGSTTIVPCFGGPFHEISTDHLFCSRLPPATPLCPSRCSRKIDSADDSGF
jgi:hypothetical protein